MTDPERDPVIRDAVELLEKYGFDLGAFSGEQLVSYWSRRYSPPWIRTAIIEALYQGRYKAVSVGQILAIWGRRGRSIYHFNGEFERIVSGKTFSTSLSVNSENPSAANAARAEAATPVEEVSSSPAAALDDEAIAPTSSENVVAEPPPDSPAELNPRKPSDIFAEENAIAASTENGNHPSSASFEFNPEIDLNDFSATGESQVAILPLDQELSDSSVLAQRSQSNGAKELTLPPVPTLTSKPLPASNHAGSPEIWVHGDVTKYPIHRFVPEPEGSVFYVKLRAVAYDVVFPQVNFY